MRAKIKLTDEQIDALVLMRLKESLSAAKSVQFKLRDGRHFVSKKDIKALKRVIRYYTGKHRHD